MADALKIPIANLFYLLCYAWDVLPERGLVNVNTLPGRRVNDLLAAVLCSGLHRLLRQGLERDYLETRDELRGIKGKLDLGASLKGLLLERGRAVCRFAVLSPDTPANRVIRATIRSLIKDRALDQDLRHTLAGIHRRLPEILQLPVTRQSFRRIRFHRNNRLYRLVVNVCRLWLERSFVDERSGTVQFHDFERSEENLRRLFEAFVRNFYKHELSGARVGSIHARWKARSADPASLDRLPILKTDTSILRGSDLIVIETKFTDSTRRFHGVERLREPHLYQILAYLQNLRRDPRFEATRVAGVLLYPRIGSQPDHDLEILGFPLLVRHLDLSANWQDVEASLMRIPSDAARYPETERQHQQQGQQAKPA